MMSSVAVLAQRTPVLPRCPVRLTLIWFVAGDPAESNAFGLGNAFSAFAEMDHLADIADLEWGQTTTPTAEADGTGGCSPSYQVS